MNGKTILITGAGRGLGRATAIALSKLGARLILLARTAEQLQQTQSMLHSQDAILIPTDISSAVQVQEMANQLSNSVGQIDVLVNNAAGWYQGGLHDIDPVNLGDLISTTITGTILITKYLMPLLEKGSSPHIVNIVSIAGLPCRNMDPSTSSTAYHAAKFGQAGFSESLRAEVKDKGIRVSTLYPGAFASDSTLDDTDADIISRYGMGVMGVRDVVESILFTLSRSSVATIQSLVIA
ncbi:MAG: SDR family oxidoreductase [Chlamydiales bacterium]|nr:SDR family oxidoreductase [Chlamydiales bacterium]